MAERDYREYAQRLLRHTFSKDFNAAAGSWRRETDVIRDNFLKQNQELSYADVVAKAKGPDPYVGRPMPVTANNGLGTNYTDPRDNLVVRAYGDDAHRPQIQREYDSLVKVLNFQIGFEFPVSKTDIIRDGLTVLWGEQMNLSLPFGTGHEPYFGSQYAEIVLAASTDGFRLTGFAFNRANYRPHV